MFGKRGNGKKVGKEEDRLTISSFYFFLFKWSGGGKRKFKKEVGGCQPCPISYGSFDRRREGGGGRDMGGEGKGRMVRRFLILIIGRRGREGEEKPFNRGKRKIVGDRQMIFFLSSPSLSVGLSSSEERGEEGEKNYSAGKEGEGSVR